jgi:hypothetical protein
VRAGSPVLIKLAGVRGVSSSFFNTLVQQLIAELGAEVVESMVALEYETETQRQIALRSLNAVRGAA